jgi:lipopolysaccharide export system permease protein
LSAAARPLARRRRTAGPGLRLTLIDRYLLRLLVVRAGAAFAVIFTVTLLERSLRLATQMVAAGAHMRFLPAMIWNLAPHYVALAAPDAFLIGMLLTIARLDEDLEIVAMLASGFPLGRLAGDLVGLGLAVAAASVLVLGFLEPLGLYGFRAVRVEAVETGWTAQAQPWAFQGRAGAVMLTADGADGDGRRLTDVFVRQRTGRGVETVLTAHAGQLGLEPDGRTASLALGEGRAWAARDGAAPVVGRFGGLALRDPYPVQLRPPVRGERPQELTLPELARAPAGASGRAARSELYARLARMLSMPVLPFLALPMAVATRRERRWVGMLAAGGVAVTFRELFRLTQRLGETGRVEPLTASLAAFVLFVAVVGWIFLSNRQLHGDTRLARLVARLQGLVGRRARPAVARSDPHASVRRYLRGVVGRSILATGAAMVGLLVMIDLFERTGDILDRGFGLAGLARYAVLRAPVLAEQAVPLATLLGTGFALLRLARGAEILAVRSLGISLVQMARMVLPAGLAACAVSVVLAEAAAPAAQYALARWWGEGVGAEPAPAERWFRLGGDLVAVRAASRDGARLSDVVIYRRSADGLLDERIAAKAASAPQGPGGWRLDQASATRIDGVRLGAGVAPPAGWGAGMGPADVRSLFARPLQISTAAAWRALRGRAPTDLSHGFLETRLHRALAEPFAPLVMLLLALPLALTSARTGPSPGSILWVFGAGALYVVVDGVLTAAGQTGLAPPWLAAWFAPILFLGLAASAFLMAED